MPDTAARTGHVRPAVLHPEAVGDVARRRPRNTLVRALNPRRRLMHLNAVLRLARHDVGARPYVRGRAKVPAKDLHVGDDFVLWSSRGRVTLLAGEGRITIGDRVFINEGAMIFSQGAITIGDDVAIADGAYLIDTDSHGIAGQATRVAPVRIGNGAWVGARAMVLPGVSVGEMAVVAAGAVVTRDVPRNCIVAGNPARIVREIDYPPGVTRAWTG